MILGRVIGKTSTKQFAFKVEDTAHKFEYVQVMHYSGVFVLAMIEEIEKDSERSVAFCCVIGFRDDEGKLQTLKSPLDPGVEVLRAEDDFIKDILGLEKKKNSAYIGILDGRDHLKVYLDMHKVLSNHVVILARSGSGKSYCTSVLLEELLLKKIPIVVIDSHGEYTSLKYPNPKDKENMIRFGIEAQGFLKQIQEFSPDTKVNPDAKPLKLSNRNLSSAELIHMLPTKLSSSQLGLVYAALKNLGGKVDFNELLIELESTEDNNSKWTLIHIFEYVKKLNLFSESPTLMGELVQGGKMSIINLRGVAQDIQEIVVYKLIHDLFEERKKNTIPPFFLVIEECHNFCFTQDTKILTSNGEQNISKISPNDLIATFNFTRSTLEYNPPTKIFEKREAEVYVITTTFGNKIKTTKDHPFFTKNGFVPAACLEECSIPLQSTYKMSKDLVTARLIGHLLGDGWITQNATRSGTVGFSGRKEDLMRIKEDLTYLGFSSSNTHKIESVSSINSIDNGILEVSGGGYSMTSSTNCFKFFTKKYYLPIGRRVLQSFLIPDFIMNGSLKIKAEFLGALMGSDGFKIRIKNKNSEVIRLSFSKIEQLEHDARVYASQIIQLFKDFKIKVKYNTKNGNIRKNDGLKTKKYVFDISNKNDNLYKFVSKIGFRYHHEKEILSKKVLYYYKHKLNIISKKEGLRKKVIRFRSKTHYGKVKLARHFGLPVALVRNWIYDTKAHKRSDTAGLGRMNFLPFQEWCQKYCDLHFIYDPVLQIKPLGEEYVYNFSIQNENYIANNILVHNCPERSFGEAKSSSIIRQVAAEGRKFGLGLCLITQRPSRADKSAISQASTQIILKVTNTHDIKAISHSIEGITMHTEKEIQNIPIGTALITGIVDVPLLVNIRPRMSKHGGEAVSAFLDDDNDVQEEKEEEESFVAQEKKYEDEGEAIALVRQQFSMEDVKLMHGNGTKISLQLIPAVLMLCSRKGEEFKILIDLIDLQVIEKLEDVSGLSLLKLHLEELNFKQEQLLNIALKEGREIKASELFAKSGMQFSDLSQSIDVLVRKGYLIRVENNYTLSPSLEFLSTIDGKQFYHPIIYGRSHGEKIVAKYPYQVIKDFLNKFFEVKDVKECWVEKYTVLSS
ncbi:MAG: DUF87 domain-containing protein [bacterium]|nr:DUF87 domain-containing protein [bacterium]